jgi:uncharacterized membrane protein
VTPARSSSGRFRRRFISGLLVVVPLVVTYLMLKFLFETIDGILAPVVQAVFKRPIPGVGLLATLLLVIIAGWIAPGVAGGRLLKMWENWLVRLPLVRIVYGGVKQVLESVSKGKGQGFRQVGLVEYPRAGVLTVCFLSNRLEVEGKDGIQTYVSAFIPSTPTPFTGFVILVRPEDIIPLNLSVEDAIKLVVSGGIVAPPRLVQGPPGDV